MTLQLLTTPTVTTPPLLTGEELFKMGDIGRSELVKGELIRLMPTGLMHGIVEIKITTLLNTFVTQHKLGYVFGGETGLYTHRNPDTVRGVDAAYISHKHFAQIKSASYLDVAPELVVEVMSPDDSWAEINDKIEEYFEIGVQLIWIVNPKRKRVHVYTTFTHLEIFNVGDTLTGGEILPQFELPVAAIFD